jgi:Spy/CpxP family protein refolding chaperone
MQNIKTYLIILAFFLLGTNIATFFVYQKHINRDKNVLKYRLELPDSRIGRYINYELDLDEDQMVQFRKFRRKYNRKANGILNDMQDIRSEMLEVFRSKDPDSIAYKTLASQLGNKHQQLKIMTFGYYTSMLGVLKEEQKSKMSELFEAMLTHEGNAKTPQHHDKGDQTEGKNDTKIEWDAGEDSLIFEEFHQR